VNGEQVARRVDFVPQRSGVERRELELSVLWSEVISSYSAPTGERGVL